MKKENFNIVLVHPQIPNNTGNIGRLCVGSQSKLHLVKPLGFEITDTRVKRAGLDYWTDLDLTYYDNFEALIESIPDMSRVFFFTTRASNTYYDASFEKGDWLVFGRESDGLPPAIVDRFSAQCVKIPFPGKVRSFNLSNAVAMALGEGLRQFR
jgi:tRNA (cytidine/uridine-2'-O-)-methyltransferase